MCPELCAGVFIRTFTDARYGETSTLSAEAAEPEYNNLPQTNSRPSTGTTIADEDDSEAGEGTHHHDDEPLNEHGYYQVKSTQGTERLVGHIIATKTLAAVVTDASMEIPSLDEFNRLIDPVSDARGHHEDGSTVAIHSVVVDPEFQGRSIGSIMLKDYIQRMTTLHIAARFALLAHERLIPFYKQHEFVSQGESEVTFSGGGWYSLIRPISESDEDE